MMLSFGQSLFIIDPLKGFLITAIISFRIRRPYNDDTLVCNDLFTGTLLANNIMANVQSNEISNEAYFKSKF